MNTCRIERQNRITKSNLAQLSKIGTDAFDEKKVGEFTSPTFRGFGLSRYGTPLTKIEKLRLISIAKEDALVRGESDTVKALDDLKTAVEAVSLTPCKVITRSKFLSEQYPVIKNPLDLDFVQINNFIPIFNSKLNSEVYKNISNAFIANTQFDHKTGPITSSESLFTHILLYKAQLINTLYNWVNKTHGGELLKEGVTRSVNLNAWDQEQAKRYKTIMRLAWKKIEGIVSDFDGQVNIASSTETKASIIDPIVSFYILQNFDACVENLSQGVIFDHTFNNSIDPVSNKYFLKSQIDKIGSYNEDFVDLDAEDKAPNLLKTFLKTLQMSNGSYLDSGFLQQMFVGLGDVLENSGDLDLIYQEEVSRRSVIDALKSQSVKNELAKRIPLEGYELFIDALETYDENYMRSFEKGVMPFDEDSQVRREKDVYQSFIDYLRNQHPNTFVCVDESGNVSLQSSLNKEKAKIGVLSAIRTAVKSQLLQGNFYKYTSEYVVSDNTNWENFSDVFDPVMQREIQKLIGISINTARMQELFKEPSNVSSFIRFMSTLGNLVVTHFKTSSDSDSIDANMESFLDELKRTPGYVVFSGLVVGDNLVLAQKNQDQNGNDLPVLGVNTTIASFKKNWSRFVRTLPKEVSDSNLLSVLAPAIIKTERDGKIKQDNPLTQHIVWAGDYAVRNGSGWSFLKATDLNVSELGTVGLFIEYMNSYINQGVVLVQSEAYSDKVRIAKAAWALANAKIGGRSFMDLDISEIQERAHRQHSTYYKALEQDVLSGIEKIFGIAGKTFQEGVIALEEHIVFESKDEANLYIADKVAEYQEAHRDDNQEFLNELNWCIKKDKNGKYRISINDCVRLQIAAAYDEKLFKELRDRGYNSFLESLKTEGIAVPEGYLQNLQNILKNGDDVSKQRVKQLFGKDVTIEDLVNILAKKDFSSKTAQYFLRKYFEISNALREADLAVSLKTMEIHGSSSANLLGNVNFKDSAVIDSVLKEMSARLNKGKKRMNAGPASYASWSLDTKYGLGKRVKVSTIAHALQPVANHFGNQDVMNSHDGAIFSSRVLRRLEENSYNGHNVPSTNKIIMLHPTPFGFRQIKCADYTMTNAWIRNSIKASSGSIEAFDGDRLMRRMLADSLIPSDMNMLLEGWEKAGFPVKGYTFFQHIDGKLYQLSQIRKSETGEYDFVWRLESGGEQPEIVFRHGLNNLYDLWKAFGGEYVESFNDEGKIDYSDNSQDIIADLMSNYDPSLKEKMIGKLVDIESDKSSAGPINSKNKLLSSDHAPLAYNYIDSADYGIQQDYSHEGEDSVLASPTQVINAIGFNGQNVDLAGDAYKTLSDITNRALEKFARRWEADDQTGFHKYMADELMHALKTNSLSSNAQQIVQTALANLKSMGTLPYSNSQIYYLATSTILTNLNRGTIKQKFSGIAVVQNPSNGIIGIYEDVNGVTYQQTQIKRLADEFARNNNFSGSHQEIIDYFLKNDARFADTIVTSPSELNIGEWVKINDKLLKLNTPAELYYCYDLFKKGSTIVKVHNMQRDLATTRITWDGGNLWLLNSTRALFEYNDKNNKISKKLLLKWQQANLKGLREKNAYYYNTFDDFKKGKQTFVQNVTYRGGEEILPKQYKTLLGLEDDFATIKANPNYFQKIVRKRYKIDPVTQAVDFGKSAVKIACNNYDIVIAKSSENSNPIPGNVTVNEFGEIYDAFGNKFSDLENPFDTTNIAYTKFEGSEKSTLIVYVSDEEFDADFSRKVKRGFKKVANAYYGAPIENLNREFNVSSPESSIRKLAADMYHSWELVCKTVSIRIPSQSFQSFLANETVGYTEDLTNNGYMNIWEMWFQGSDFDIDKAYTIMWELDNKGKIAGHNLTDYSSMKSIEDSFSLPLPNPSNQISQNNGNDDVTQELIDLINALNEGGNRIELFKTFLKELNTKINPFYIPQNGIDLTSLVNEINEYQSDLESNAVKRNRVMYAVRKASSDLANLKASEVPMEASPVTKKINKYTKVKNVIYNNLNPYTIYRIQRENSIGKKDVGIAANGVKAAGSLQQFFNMENLHNSGAFSHISIDLGFTLEDRVIKEHITSLANTVSDFETFEKRLLNGQNKNIVVANHPKYEIFKAFKENIPIENLSEADSQYLDNLNQQKTLGIKYNEDADGFIKSLYDCLSYEDNVADMLSIFISLATDNAKELALAKMYGNQELLSIPLTMITLGMNIDDVVKLCIDLLEPVAKELDQNRFRNPGSNNVRQIIARIKSYPDAMTQKSLLKIYDIAQEFRMLTQFFKVNQGITPNYAELSAFLRSLSKQYMKATGEKQPLNFNKLFTDPEEQARVIQKYEEHKSGFNIMKIIFNTPHFNAQLRSIAVTLNMIENMSFVANTVSKFTHDTESSIENQNDKTSESKGRNYKGKSEDVNFAKKLTKLVNQFVISKGLQNMGGLTFLKGSAVKYFGEYDSNLSDSTPIELTSSEGVNRFIDFMEHDVIPYLLDKYSDNFFVQNLVLKQDFYTKRAYWDLGLDTFESKRDLSIAENINRAAAEYQQFAYKMTGITTIDGHNLSIGDLFYLYNLITSRNAIKGSTTCVYDFVRKENPKSPISHYVDDVYFELDKLTQMANKGDTSAQEQIAQLQAQIEPYVKALSNPNGISTVKNVTYDLKKNFIQVMDRGKNTSYVSFTSREVSKFISDKLVGIKDLEVTVDPKNKSLNLKFSFGLKNYNASYTLYDGKENNFGELEQAMADDLGYIAAQIQSSIGNIQSILNTSFKGEGQYIADGTLQTLEDISSNFKIPEPLKTISEINDWITGTKFAAIIDARNRFSDVHTHIEWVGNKPFLFVNTSGLIGDKNAYINDFITAYFQSKTPNVLSEQDKLKYALGMFLDSPKNELGLAEAPLDVLENKTVQEMLKNNQGPIVTYIRYLLGEGNVSYLKKIARDNLVTFSAPLQNQDIYYKKADESDELKEGDIFQNKESILKFCEKVVEYARSRGANLPDVTLSNLNDFTGLKYFKYYAEYKKLHPEEEKIAKAESNMQWVNLGMFEGKTIYCRIENLNNLSRPVVKVQYNIDNSPFVRTKTLRYRKQLVLKSTSPLAKSEYENDYSSVSDLSDINLQDRIAITNNFGAQEYFVSDIIYERGENDSLEPVLIGYRVDSSYAGKMKLQIIPIDGELSVKHPKTIFSSSVVRSSIEWTNIINLSEDVKSQLIMGLRQGDPVKINNREYIFDRLYPGELSKIDENTPIQVIDNDGNAHGFFVKDLVSVAPSSIRFLDKGFLQNAYQPRIVVEGTESEKIPYSPLLVDGFQAEIDVKRDRMFITPGIWIPDKNGIPRFVRKTFLGDVQPSGFISPEDTIEEGNYLVKNEGDVPVAMKVLSVENDPESNENNITVVYTNIGEKPKTTLGVTTYPRSHFNGNTTLKYTKNQRGKYSPLVHKGTLPVSLQEKGEKIISMLAKHFGTTVQIVDSLPDNAFAEVKNGVVLIAAGNVKLKEYRDLYGKEITAEQYIASQALHEFTHLILASMRIKSPESYKELSQKILENIKESQLDYGNFYDSQFAKTDEFIARAVEDYVRNSKNEWIESGTINSLLTSALKNVFGVSASNGNKNLAWKTIESVLPGKLFNMNDYSDIQSMKLKYVSDKILENINC